MKNNDFFHLDEILPDDEFPHAQYSPQFIKNPRLVSQYRLHQPSNIFEANKSLLNHDER